MSRFLSAVLLVLISLSSNAAQEPPPVASTNKLSPEQEKAKLHLPPGFELQLVASEPDIHKPLNMNFDERGRLWLSDTVEYPYPAKDRPGRDRVMILDDFGPDGKARKITTFADGSTTAAFPTASRTATGCATPPGPARPTSAKCSTARSARATRTAWSTASPSATTAGSTPATAT